jgi:molybdenum cofactor cytidylyltransferase
MSRRFGAANKLLADVAGESVVRRSARAYVDGGLDPVMVVVGHEAEAVHQAVAGLPLRIVHNPEYEQGQSRALVHGIAALPGSVAAAVIGVGDQPWLQPGTIARLVETWRRTGVPIVAPRYSGERGNPVLFARSLFAELMDVTGDVGGRPVIQRHRDEVLWVPIPGTIQACDVDTPGDLPD